MPLPAAPVGWAASCADHFGAAAAASTAARVPADVCSSSLGGRRCSGRGRQCTMPALAERAGRLGLGRADRAQHRRLRRPAAPRKGKGKPSPGLLTPSDPMGARVAAQSPFVPCKYSL